MWSLALCRDILAIRCIKTHVCVGVGNSVEIYCIATKILVGKFRVLENDNVHSIVPGPGTKVIVDGGKSLRICKLTFTGNTVKFDLCSAVQQFSDWIIAAEPSKKKDNDGLRILFAHNNLGFYNPSSKQTRSIWCQEKCILYGGSLLSNDNEETVVLSGTVFQEILIWLVKSDQEYPKDVPILHRLKGHKGVIFSVVYDAILRILSSTSDDRTVRVWRVKNKIVGDSDELDWSNSEISLTTTMYGHTARVWRSVIKNDRILSIGEDSLMCTWSLAGELLSKVEAHHGAEIWSIDVSEDSQFVFTGGTDGSVNVWHFDPAEPLRATTLFGSDSFTTIPKYVRYMNSGTTVLFMDGGTLISYDDDLKKTQKLAASSSYTKRYWIMEISPDRTKIALGSMDGYVQIFEEYADSDARRLRRVLEQNVMKSKIFSLHWLTEDTILFCGDAGRLKIVDVLGETKNREQSEFVLPPCRERWTTAATAVKNLLICGDRAGTVYVFNLAQGNAEPAQMFPKIHGRLGVQSLFISGDKVLSTGRDGTLRYYEHCHNEENRYLEPLHLHKMVMDWVSKVLRCNGDLLVLGFKEVEFVIYSMNLRRFVLRFVCGGGHRSWDCQVSNGLMKFVYIKDKQVYEVEGPLSDTNPAIRIGYHTKEIYCVEPIATSSRHSMFVSASEDCTLRVNCLADKQLQPEKCLLSPLSAYDGHISNVKAVAVLNLENSEKRTKSLVFSGGGRAQLKVWEIAVRVNRKTLGSQDVKCRELLSHMLLGNDKQRKKTWPNARTGFFADPETRIMDISAQFYLRDPNFIILFLACSDGLLRILLYNAVNNRLFLNPDVNACNRCILKVHSFVHKAYTIIISMTTDGNVSFWQTNEKIERLVRSTRGDFISENGTATPPFTKIKIHQSGINSFDFRKVDDSRYLLLTGGDDNLISLVMFEISSTGEGLSACTLSTWKSSSAHSAQVTGTKFVGKNRLLTAGIDQRIFVYSYSLVDEILSVVLMDEAMTFVPDVQGVTLCCPAGTDGETLACVYGKGLEVIALNKESD